MISAFIIIDEVRQPVNYFILPSSQTDELFINLPEVIHEKCSDWIEDDGLVDLFLEAPAKKYTFTKTKVEWCKSVVNRYGENSRDLKISFVEMHFGFIRRNKC